MNTDKVIFGVHMASGVVGLSCVNIPGLFSCVDDDWTDAQVMDNLNDALDCYEDELESRFIELSVQDIRTLSDEYEDGFLVYDRVKGTLIPCCYEEELIRILGLASGIES